jgi:pyruvate dehydrogenase E1 component
MIPIFIYYSMFGFQRIGDLIWAAGDCRARGFMLGGTAGRTTLNGEGLQHQDGHSHLFAMAFPTVRSYDPAFVYETTVIMLDGLERMYGKGEDWIYYITVYNENYEMPSMPAGCEEGILKGMYRLKDVAATGKPVGAMPPVQLLGSGAILREVIRAADLLAEHWGIASTVWSVTSWKELRREAQECRRWNMLHPEAPPRQSYLEQTLGDYEQAMGHLRACYSRLEQAERRIELLAGFDAEGGAELVEFEDGAQGLEEQLAQGRSGRGNTRTAGVNKSADGGTPRSKRRVDDL